MWRRSSCGGFRHLACGKWRRARRPGLRQAVGGSGFPSCIPFAASLISCTLALPSTGSDVLGALPTIVCSPRSSYATLSWERAWIRNPGRVRPLRCARTYFVLLHGVNAGPRFLQGDVGGPRSPHPSCSRRTAWLVWALPRSSGGTVVTCVKTLRFDEQQKRQQQTPRHERKGFGLSGVVGNAEEETTMVLTPAEWLRVAFARLFCARAFCRPEPGVRYSHSLTPSPSLSA